MTSLPMVLNDEPLGIILRDGQPPRGGARIWAYCWCADEASADDPPHRRLPVKHTR